MQVKLTVTGKTFTVACERGGEEELRRAAKTVEEAIGKVREKWRVADGERAAIMAALTLAHKPRGGAPQTEAKTMERISRRIDAALLRTVPRGRASEGVDQ